MDSLLTNALPEVLVCVCGGGGVKAAVRKLDYFKRSRN